MASNLTMQVVLQALDKITAPVRQATQSTDKLSKALGKNQSELKRLQEAQKNLKAFEKLRVQAAQSNSAIRENQQRLAAVTREINQSTAPTKALLRERDKLTRQSAALNTRYQQERSQMMELSRQIKGTDTGTGSLADRNRYLAERINEANAAIKQQQSRLKAVGDIQARSAKLAQQHGKEMHRIAMLGGLGAAGVAVGQKVYSGASRMLAPGIAFGEQMSELRAVSRMGADDDRFLRLQQQARDLGASTAFTAADAAAGQTFLARAGFSPEAIHASMQDMLNLALANKMDLARAADIASNISSAFKIDPEAEGSMQRVGDVLSGVAARSNVNLEMLGETMKYLGGAEDLNISLEQAAAMAGLMGNIGIQGSQAGTAMRAMMNRLTAPAKSGVKAMESIGLAVTDAKGNMRDMPDILMDISKATQHMGNAQRKEIMKHIFGTEAGSGMTELVGAMADGQLMELLTALQTGVTGENAKMAGVMADNIGGDLKGLVSAWEEVGIAMTTANGGPIRELVQSVTGIVRWIGQWIAENPKLAATIGKVVGGIALVATVLGGAAIAAATVLGPLSLLKFGLGKLLLAGLKFAPVLKGIGVAFVALGKAMLANPIFLAIAALAGAAYLIYRNWDAVVGFFASIWDGIKEAFSGGVAGVSSLIINWSPLGLFYKAFAGVMSWFGIELPDKFTEFGGMLVSGLINGIKAMAGKAKEAIVGIGENVTGWFKDKLGIRSPSRVFMELGGDTMDGLSLGLHSNQQGPLKQVAGLGKQLAAAGAIAFAGPALAGGMQFDSRPPISSAAPVMAGGAGDNIAINVHAAPGMDTAELARLVQMELQKHQMQQQVRRRSTFGDLD